MHPLIERLQQEGCNVEGALDTCMGMEDFYIKMLRMLASDGQMERLRAAVAAQDAREIFEASHALKGIYANLGLTPLLALDTPLVEKTRSGSLDGVNAMFRALQQRHNGFVQIIRCFE